MPDTLVVGAGPVGLTLAAELARHGVRCRIVDRAPQPLPYCRAIGVTPRTLEVWEDMGVARAMIDAGLWLEGNRSVINDNPAHDSRETFPDLPYGALGLPQYETERILARHLAGFGVEIERDVALSTLSQTADAVTARLGAETATFRYVIGCDGAHSAVRHALGIAFEGDAYPMQFMLGDVHIAWDLPRGIMFRALRHGAGPAPDFFIAIPLPDPGRYRVTMLAPDQAAPAGSTDHGIQAEARGPTLSEIQAIADRLVPGHPAVTDLRWSSAFRISMRLAARYRDGRVFIAGDAAHIHPPTGGQGMNTGIQDAYNLAWKLALVLRDAASTDLLDSYESERRPVGADVLARTRAATENYGREPGGKPDRYADTQIRVSYRATDWVRDDAPNLDPAVPTAGDRAPDAGGLARQNINFPLRLFDLLRGADHVLVAHLAADASPQDLADWVRETRSQFGPHVRTIAITGTAATSDQPGVAVHHDRLGAFANAYGATPASFLIRPDGYIGWRGPSWRDPGLAAHLRRIFK